jgi:SSS family transporter
VGLLAAGRQRDADDYFLGRHSLPWPAVAFSTVATETSALTVISVPATAYTGDLWMLQLAFGYLFGRIVVAALILPLHFRRGATTTYGFLNERFGPTARRFASVMFLVTRALGDSVRVFAASIPIALLSGLPYWQSILITGLVTLAYTYWGGLRAVVWVDVIQLVLYISGGVVAVILLGGLLEGGWSAALASLPEGKTDVLHFEGGFADGRWILTGLVGGAFLSMASHGTDQLIVQRLLTCRDLRSSQRALVGSGIVVIAQFAIFLVLGLGLWAFYGGRRFESPDVIFPMFIIEQLPPGVTGLVIAAVFAAAMSTLSSSINSLASSTAYDFWAPLAGVGRDDARILKAGRAFTLVWAALLVGGAIVFTRLPREAASVEVALGIASVVYGGLLGAFGLGVLSERADQRSVIVGMALGIGTVAVIWRTVPSVAFPWYVLIGSVITFTVGHMLGRGGTAPLDDPLAAAAALKRAA